LNPSIFKIKHHANKALIQRQNKLGRRVCECNTRIIWTNNAVVADDVLETGEFVTWHPDEDIPEGEKW